MRAGQDPDLLLIEAMLAPPPLDDARSSLEYWQRRRRNLPLYRLSARREAREMATLWVERVQAAERARFESSRVGRLLTALGFSSLWPLRARFAKQGLFWLVWAFVPRRLKYVVGGLVAVALMLMMGAVTALALVFDRLG
jgi:hypothetical protein